MYPGFIVEYEDRSQINKIEVQEVDNSPLFVSLFTSDKGTEDFEIMTGDDFFTMYGSTISFVKHGQPLLQTAMAINKGGRILCKRLVSDDAALANIGIVASISSTTSAKTDDEGNALYTDADGNETTEATDSEGNENTPITTTDNTITYSLKTASNAYDIQDAYEAIDADCGENDYLLYVITDIGRGTSKKRIKIVPNYRLSKNQQYTLYTLYVLEDSNTVESMTFSTRTNLIASGQNISLQNMINNNSTQLRCYEDTANIEAFVTAVADLVGSTYDEMVVNDLLFGYTNKGVAISGVTVDTTDGINLQYDYGQMLTSGSNGTFGAYPIKNTEEWSKQAIAVIDGTFSPEIFDLDKYKICAWVDANYPTDVKRALEKLAEFREDFMYFRDQGLTQTSMDNIKATCLDESHNKFCASYFQSYDVIDPYTKRQITVTIGYSLAQLLVTHLDNGSILPTAGIKHSMIITEAIKNTVSFVPTICPDYAGGNQKEELDDIRANYASYIDEQLVIETLYTSQEEYTQWSFINNVMGIQDVVKAIRTRCPAIRYSFIDGTDLEVYKADVTEVLDKYQSQFKSLTLEYVADATYTANKIFYAVLYVQYRDFVQTEWFKVIALSSDAVVEE